MWVTWRCWLAMHGWYRLIQDPRFQIEDDWEGLATYPLED